VLAGAAFVFFYVAAQWAYYHLVKQHYGFMVLYKKKNGDLARIDNALDRLLLLFAFNYPFVEFIARDPEAMARVPAMLRGGVSGLAKILLAGTILLSLVWLGRQIQRANAGEPLNFTKYLLLAAPITIQLIVLLTPMPHKPIAIVAILTIYHNFQYHRLIWFHNRKYRPETREKYGAAEFISRRLMYYIALGIGFGILYQGPRQILGYIGLQNGAPSFTVQLGISFLWGYAFIHYYLDSKIWRVRRDPSVGEALKMS
jgi:hypothetical protein